MGWWFNLFSYFLENVLIWSLTYLTCRSLCSVSLLTYHGALLIRRRVLFCIRWMVLIFDFFAQPHNCMPYVQIGIRITLYINSLLLNDNFDFRPINQYSCLIFKSICFLFAFKWFFHVNRLSKCIPRYLTSVLIGNMWLFNATSGHVACFVVNVMFADFVSFILILHLFTHCWILSSDFWSNLDAYVGFSCEAKYAVSSAKVSVLIFGSKGRSAVNSW